MKRVRMADLFTPPDEEIIDGGEENSIDKENIEGETMAICGSFPRLHRRRRRRRWDFLDLLHLFLFLPGLLLGYDAVWFS